MASRARRPPTRVALVGIHGHGRWHLADVGRLAADGLVELVGVCDPRPPSGDLVGLVGSATWSADLDELLTATRSDVTIVATPIHTHVDLALEAARSGSHLLLEKPPAPSLAEFERLLAGIADAGVTCQVGFQLLGSGAVDGLRAAIDDGRLGELRGIGAECLYVRDTGYFCRASWAGHRRLGGEDVVDGALTNPFLHAVAGAIRIAAAERPGMIAGTELELYRANPIESDDTSVVRLVTTSGVTIVVAATLCAAVQVEPLITVHGADGRASWQYRTDVVRFERDGAPDVRTFQRAGLLENLVRHVRDPDVPLLVPLAGTRAVTEFVDAVRRAPDPVPIAPELRRPEGDGPTSRWVVSGVDEAVQRCAAELSVFSEQSVPWAVPAAADRVIVLSIDDRPVADYQLAPDVDATLSPRPFLDPVRTLGGTVVSGRGRDDHPWHLGVGVAIQDVGGVNFWGGRTYVAGHGYQWLDDHGSIRHLTSTHRETGGFAHDLAWMTPDHRCLLVERRTISAAAVPRADDRWILSVSFTLTNVAGRSLALASPGSHGRAGGGYGGFFWRLPPVAGSTAVCTERASGEHRVHGTVAAWLAWIADSDDPTGSFTIVAAPDDEATAADPWFVRLADYPGFGSALAWDRPLHLAAGETARRGVRAIVVDGAGHRPASLYDQLRAHRRSPSIGAERDG